MMNLSMYRVEEFQGAVFIQHSLPENDRVLDRILYLGLALEPVAIAVNLGDDSCNFAVAQRDLDLNFPWIFQKLQEQEPDTWTLRDGVLFGDRSQLAQTAVFEVIREARIIARAKLRQS